MKRCIEDSEHRSDQSDGEPECESCLARNVMLCSMCHECGRCCIFGAEVCLGCGGHKEGLEVPGDKYCEECACNVCGALFGNGNEYQEDVGCTSCAGLLIGNEEE